jgi:catechol 2,3-dioxygenase-like lactoylglutathione lyase family enzyme
MATRIPRSDVARLGAARLEVAMKAKTPDDWKKMWPKPANAWTFEWGSCWKQCIEYRVDDFASEVGFFIDVLGLPTNAFGPDYAMFTGPGKDFYFAVVPTPDDGEATAPDTIRLAFMIADIHGAVNELEARGVQFEKRAESWKGSPIHSCTFRTPAGVAVDLWGMVDPKTAMIKLRPEKKAEKKSDGKAKVGAK